jgi:hypothetical protein
MGVRWHLIREFFGPNQFDSGSFWSNIQGRMSDISHDVNDEFVPEDELEAPQAAIKKTAGKIEEGGGGKTGVFGFESASAGRLRQSPPPEREREGRVRQVCRG